MLRRHSSRPERLHDGKVITLASDLRWCSDGFEIRCWNDERSTSLSAWIAATARRLLGWAPTASDGRDIRDLMAMTVEARFNGTHTLHPVEWLTTTVHLHGSRNAAFGAPPACSCAIPSYSPESNGMPRPSSKHSSATTSTLPICPMRARCWHNCRPGCRLQRTSSPQGTQHALSTPIPPLSINLKSRVRFDRATPMRKPL